MAPEVLRSFYITGNTELGLGWSRVLPTQTAREPRVTNLKIVIENMLILQESFDDVFVPLSL